MSDKKYRPKYPNLISSVPENHIITIQTTHPTIISFYEDKNGSYPASFFDLPIIIKQLCIEEQVLHVMENAPKRFAADSYISWIFNVGMVIEFMAIIQLFCK